MYYFGLRDGKMEKDGKNKSQHLVFSTTTYLAILKVERKKNEEIRGRISMRNLVLFHIKQQMIHNTCTTL